MQRRPVERPLFALTVTLDLGLGLGLAWLGAIFCWFLVPKSTLDTAKGAEIM
jgi:hypothetical protein